MSEAWRQLEVVGTASCGRGAVEEVKMNAGYVVQKQIWHL